MHCILVVQTLGQLILRSTNIKFCKKEHWTLMGQIAEISEKIAEVSHSYFLFHPHTVSPTLKDAVIMHISTASIRIIKTFRII